MALRCQSCAAVARGHVHRHGVEFASCGDELCGERLTGGVRAPADGVLHFHETSPMALALRETFSPAVLAASRTADRHYALPHEVAKLLATGLVCQRVGPEEDETPPRPLSTRRQVPVQRPGRGERVPRSLVTTTTPSRKRSASATGGGGGEVRPSRAPDQFAYLFDLPLDAWSNVLRYLDPADRAAFAATSTRAHEIATKPQVLGPILAARMTPYTLMRLYIRLWREQRAAAAPAESAATRATRANFLEVLRFALPSIESRIAVSVLALDRNLVMTLPIDVKFDLFVEFTRYNPVAKREERDISWFLAPAYHDGPIGAAVAYALSRFLSATPWLEHYQPDWLADLVLLTRKAPLETPRSQAFWSVVRWVSRMTEAQQRFTDQDTQHVVFDPYATLVARGVTFGRGGAGACLAALARERLREQYVAALIGEAGDAVEWLERTEAGIGYDGRVTALAHALHCTPGLFLSVVQSISRAEGRLVAALSASPVEERGSRWNFFHYGIHWSPMDDDRTNNAITNYAAMIDMCPRVELLAARDHDGLTPLLCVVSQGAALAQFEVIIDSHRCREFDPLATEPFEAGGRTALDILVAAGFRGDADGARLDLVRRALVNAAITGAELDASSGAPSLLAGLATVRFGGAEQTQTMVDLVHRVVEPLPVPARARYSPSLSSIFELMLLAGEYVWLHVVFLPRLGASMVDAAPSASFALRVVEQHNRSGDVATENALRLLLQAVVRLEGGRPRVAHVATEDKRYGRQLLSDDEWAAAGYRFRR